MPPPRYHLAKTDPETYSVSDFEKEIKTVWNGVTNAQAVQSIRGRARLCTSIAVAVVCLVFIAVASVALACAARARRLVGLARVDSPSRPDPENPKSAVVDLTFLRRLEPPTTLHAVKASNLFPHFALVRQSRLSTRGCPDEFVDWVRARYPKIKI